MNFCKVDMSVVGAIRVEIHPFYKHLDKQQQESFSGACVINSKHYYVYITKNVKLDNLTKLDITLSHCDESGFEILYCGDISNINSSSIRKEFVNGMDVQNFQVLNSDIQALSLIADDVKHFEW